MRILLVVVLLASCYYWPKKARKVDLSALELDPPTKATNMAPQPRAFGQGVTNAPPDPKLLEPPEGLAPVAAATLGRETQNGIQWYGRHTPNRFGGPIISADGDLKPGSIVNVKGSAMLPDEAAILWVGHERRDVEIAGIRSLVQLLQPILVQVEGGPMATASYGYQLPSDRAAVGRTWVFQWVQDHSSSVGLEVTVQPGDGGGGGSGTARGFLSQHGITWTFDREYETGRFANGDWWVIGPVRITKIDPPSVRIPGRPGYSDKSQSVINGSMVNPRGGNLKLGYDSATLYTGYSDDANVALGVSSAKPLVLAPNSSLVSTISRSKPASRPQPRVGAVLTVVENAPVEDAFRPGYAGTVKRRFRTSQLRMELLSSLPKVPSTPPLSQLEAWFEKPWLDHQATWSGPYSHPFENLPEYTREFAQRIGDGAAALHLDFSPAEKRRLLISYVQVGIDLFGVVLNGGNRNWSSNAHGRKWPILFAGLMLNDAEMKGIGSMDVWFQEDLQTFFVQPNTPGGYTPAQVGMAEWAFNVDTRRNYDARWAGSNELAYRVCCSANAWAGFILAARIMQAQPMWKHDAIFAYQDRYMAETLRRYGSTDSKRQWSAFAREMWDTYRVRF